MDKNDVKFIVIKINVKKTPVEESTLGHCVIMEFLYTCSYILANNFWFPKRSGNVGFWLMGTLQEGLFGFLVKLLLQWLFGYFFGLQNVLLTVIMWEPSEKVPVWLL